MAFKRQSLRLKELKANVKPKAKAVKMSICSFSFLILAVKTITLVLFYYMFSIGLTFYNKSLIHHFKFPLSLTMSHLIVKFALSGLIRVLIEWKTGEPRVTLPWNVYVRRLAPAGISSALDIGLSNWSFEFITVSLYTMSKSSAVIFILFFALLFKLEKWRWSLLVVVFLISTGLFMFTFHSTQFNMKGFVMVMVAALLSGLRWTLAQLLTQKHEIGLSNPLDMMYHIQPWMIITLLPLSASVEGISISTTEQLFRFTDSNIILRNCGLVLAGALLAFMLEFSEFLLVSQTSSLTLSISGIFKEICTLYLAFVYNGDSMNAVNAVGLLICLAGIVCHVLMKAYNNRQDSLKEGRHIEEMEMLGPDGDRNMSSEEEDEVYNVRHNR